METSCLMMMVIMMNKDVNSNDNDSNNKANHNKDNHNKDKHIKVNCLILFYLLKQYNNIAIKININFVFIIYTSQDVNWSMYAIFHNSIVLPHLSFPRQTNTKTMSPYPV